MSEVSEVVSTVAAVASAAAETVVTSKATDTKAQVAAKVDAFVAKERLGENAVSWDSQNDLGYQWLLVARESSTKSPEANWPVG